MGFWAKAKGVFGKIGRGAKTGWDWLTRHKQAISDVAQKATDTFAPTYSDKVSGFISRGNDLIDRGDSFRQRFN